MDIYGIGAAVAACMRTYFSCARGTGRTTLLIDKVLDGDRVIVATAAHARLVYELLHEKGKHKVDVRVLSPARFYEITMFPPSDGETHFDHCWVEEYFIRAHGEAMANLQSKFGLKAREYARQAAQGPGDYKPMPYRRADHD